MKEELKQAIEEANPYDKENPEHLAYTYDVSLAINNASILKHAEPDVMDKAGWMPKPKITKEMSEIMKAAGWVREDEIMPDVKRILLLCEENGKPVDGFAFRQSVLSLRKIIPLPQPPEKYKP